VDDVINRYKEYNSGSVNLWISDSIKTDDIPELKIGLRKLFIFNELTVSGIDSQLCVD
jgi:hypothetical protein